MIDRRKIEVVVVRGIKKILDGYNCEVIRSNQTAPAPAYPYCSYTITSNTPKAFWGKDETDYVRETKQTWSFTVQSDNDDEAHEIAAKIAEWLSLQSYTHFSDNGIAVASIGDITNRDSLITIEYEHRYGFDFVLNLLDVVSIEDVDKEIIEEVTYL